MIENIRWALLGTGRHPEMRIAPAMTAASNASLRGVWTRDRDRAAAFAGRHGAEIAYRSLDEALADVAVDAVFVATPNNLHAEHTIRALLAGKHVLVEKPMAVSAVEARAMVAAAREADRILGVGYHMRHHAVLAEAARIVLSGEVGEPIYATASFVLHSFAPPSMPNSPWKSDPAAMGGGGALMGMGVHVVDLLRTLIGREIRAVTAMSDGQRDERPLDRLAQVCFEFDGGVEAHFVCSGRYPFARNDAVIYCASGRVLAKDSVDMNPGHGSLEVMTPTSDGHAVRFVEAPVANHFTVEIEAFGNAVASGQRFRADGTDGLRAVEATDAIIASLWQAKRMEVERRDA